MIKDVFPANYSVLVLGPPGVGKFEYCIDLTKSSLERGERVVFVATDKSPQEIKARMQGMGIDVDAVEGKRFIFIDVSRSAGSYPSALCVENPTNLNLISVKMAQAVEQLGRPVRIVFDSLSNLFFHSQPREIVSFLENLTSKVETDYGFIIYTLQDGMHEPATVTAIKHISDCTIEMKLEEEPTLRHKFRVLFAKGISYSQDWFEFSVDERGFKVAPAKIPVP